eukprot:763624-Hanusia_phi.AAC.2
MKRCVAKVVFRFAVASSRNKQRAKESTFRLSMALWALKNFRWVMYLTDEERMRKAVVVPELIFFILCSVSSLKNFQELLKSKPTRELLNLIISLDCTWFTGKRSGSDTSCHCQ